ncbi:MAG: cytochrome c4 [Burkholderiales bacterium]|jgi:cytochrome c553|nr:cytochrome c4 [Burkholderiales bacterium]
MIVTFGRCALTAATLVFSSLAAAQQAPQPFKPDPARGKEIVGGVCAACHGADGNSVIAQNPKLAGQHAEYTYKQLVDYAKPQTAKDARVNAVMHGFASALSDADKRHVAAFLATQKQTPGTARNKATLELGQKIYRAGIPAKNVPACAGCHAPNGVGIPAQYPRLAGQHAEYTVATLQAFRDGTRRNNVSMAQISGRLTDDEMKAVADYIAGLR